MSVDPSRSPLNTALRALAPWLLSAAALAAISLWIRLALIEPLEWAQTCNNDPQQATCMLRSAVVALFQRQMIGWLAAAAALTGVIFRWRWLAGVALLAGTVAAVLYAVEPGLFGALLGLLGLLRWSSEPLRPCPTQTADAPISAASEEKPSA